MLGLSSSNEALKASPATVIVCHGFTTVVVVAVVAVAVVAAVGSVVSPYEYEEYDGLEELPPIIEGSIPPYGSIPILAAMFIIV